MKHLDLPTKTCLFNFFHNRHDWFEYTNRWGQITMAAGINTHYAKHFMCPGVETTGRHVGNPRLEFQSTTEYKPRHRR